MQNKYGYKDRGMMKYMSFAALETHMSETMRVLNEKFKIDKPELSEDQIDIINNKINICKKNLGKNILIKFFYNGRIAITEGKVINVNDNMNFITVGCNEIIFSDIVDISFN